MNKQTIYLATDHAGFEYKEKVKEILENKFSDTFDIIDCGAKTYDSADDYPDFISLAAEKVSKNKNSLGIIFGGSGQGEAIVANRYKNVRATVYYGGQSEILKLSKEHNNANILSLGARFIKEHELEEILTIWLHGKFSEEERHIRRIKKIESTKKEILTDTLKTCKQFLGMK